MKIHRVVVRGQFAELTDEQRQHLTDAAEEHSFLSSAFTKEGTFTYALPLVAFNFRYEVRSDDDSETEQVGAEATARAEATLSELGLACKRLRATVTDMASIWD